MAAERGKLGIDEPIHLFRVVKPIRAAELSRLAKTVGIDIQASGTDAIKILEQLIEMGKVPLTDKVVYPKVR